MWRPQRAGCDTSLASPARVLGRRRWQTRSQKKVARGFCLPKVFQGKAGGILLREFAEETLGLYGGADVNAATVKASAETMAGRLRAAVEAAGSGGGDGGERRTTPLRRSSRTPSTTGGHTYR
jgi:hypothetical protein